MTTAEAETIQPEAQAAAQPVTPTTEGGQPPAPAQQTQQQATEGAPNEGQPKGDDAPKPPDAAKADAAKQGAPEQYEPFQALDGSAIDAGKLGAFPAVARELGLPQEAAQKIVGSLGQAIHDQVEAARNANREALAADKDFGGTKLEASKALIAKVAKQLGSPEFSEQLLAGIDDLPPDMFRLLARAGQAISEDVFVRGGSVPDPSDGLRKMFPSASG